MSSKVEFLPTNETENFQYPLLPLNSPTHILSLSEGYWGGGGDFPSKGKPRHKKLPPPNLQVKEIHSTRSLPLSH